MYRNEVEKILDGEWKYLFSFPRRDDVSGAAGRSCQSPLGVSSGGIKDNQLTASSTFSSSSVGAENGRLGTERFVIRYNNNKNINPNGYNRIIIIQHFRGGGAWCPASLVRENSSEWIQVSQYQKLILYFKDKKWQNLLPPP